MAWTNYQIFLAFMMLITGSINTLSTKWADMSKAVGIDNGSARVFDHPFLQAVGMFLGELSCLAVFQISKFYNARKGTPLELGNQQFNPLLFLPAALCDMIGTSVMYVGLNLTYASSFQMLRGAVMIFTALLSVIFLRRTIQSFKWFAMAVVVCGLALVGISDMVFGDNSSNTDRNGIIAGDLLILIAQIVTATQMVYEEKYVTKHNIPALQAVGWEGFFGSLVLGILLIPMYYLKIGTPFSKDPEGRMENVKDAFIQMGNNHVIIIATIGNIVSIAFFNFSGISVTKELSATTRMVLDSCRTLIIWVVSMALLWQPFAYKEFIVQSFGFILLIVGMCIYNEIILKPLLIKCGILSGDSGELRNVGINRYGDMDVVEDEERAPLVNGSQPDPVYT